MSKLESLKKFKLDQKNELPKNSNSMSIRGGTGGPAANTTNNVPVSTDLGPNQDTDCGTDVVDDNGVVLLTFVDKESFKKM